MKFRFTDIANFVEMSSCATLTQAAQKIEISQPALSESLKRLEADVGATLFYRSRTGIRLTPTGRKFLERAGAFLRAYGDLQDKKSGELVFGGQRIVIGCHATVAQYTLPKALKFLAERAPDYNVEIRHELSREIQKEVQKGGIDIGVVVNPVAVPDLVITKVAQDIVGVWGTMKNSGTVICNPELFQVQSILRKWKGRPERILATSSLELVARLTGEGLGLGILPQRAVELAGLGLKFHDELPIYRDSICMVHRPEFGMTPAEKLVKDSLKFALN